MREFNLGIANIGKTLLIAGLTIITGPLIFFVITKLDRQFPVVNTFISILIFIIPFVIFIIWLLIQKYKDVFRVTSAGIESKSHGIIKWQDIDHCSWESIRGSISVYLKLKNKTRISFGVSTWKSYSKGYNELQDFFNEIKKTQENLPEKDKFQIYEERISGLITIAFIVFMLGLLIVLIVFNIVNKYKLWPTAGINHCWL
jgi:uncharacterized membrane protein YqjE